MQIKSTLYLPFAILKFIEFVPEEYLAIVGYAEDKPDFDLKEMDEERRELLEEWKDGIL